MTSTINFSWKLIGALGANIHLTVAGSDHFLFSHTYIGTDNVLLSLTSGVTYFITISIIPAGTLVFDVTGKYTSITPAVPANVSTGVPGMFTLIV